MDHDQNSIYLIVHWPCTESRATGACGGVKPPEAARKVAGGASAASDHRFDVVQEPPTLEGSRRFVARPFRDPFRGRRDLTAHRGPVVARYARTTGYRTRRLRRPFVCEGPTTLRCPADFMCKALIKPSMAVAMASGQIRSHLPSRTRNRPDHRSLITDHCLVVPVVLGNRQRLSSSRRKALTKWQI
jgi:hypothetical protein